MAAKVILTRLTNINFSFRKVAIFLGIAFMFSAAQIYFDMMAVPSYVINGLRRANFHSPGMSCGMATICSSNCSIDINVTRDSVQSFASETITPGLKNEDKVIMPTISLEDAFFKKMSSIRVSDIADRMTAQEEKTFKTRFLPNNNLKNFPIHVLEDICMEPNGALLFIDTAPAEIERSIHGPRSVAELYFTWTNIYACHGMINDDFCVGYNFSSRVPKNHAILRGTTAHMMPYESNPMHNWAERTWEYIMAGSEPFKSTVPHPIDHYIIHRFDKYFEESKYNLVREEILWQLRMVMEMGGSLDPNHILMDITEEGRVVCFEKMLLQQRDTDRIDRTRVPHEYAVQGVRKYRDAIHSLFGMQKPKIRLPPRKLRVLFYGRGDTLRRRVTNPQEVLVMLKNFSRPPLEVFYLDQMLANGDTNYSFPETIRIFSQTDLLIIAHGANTWSTFLLPEGAGVVEIFGPCNWSYFNYTDLTRMHSWMHVNAVAAKLKHDFSNPFKTAIPNPRRGNTTACIEPWGGVPDYTVDVEKLYDAINAFAYPSRPGDPLTKHWMYDWETGLEVGRQE